MSPLGKPDPETGEVVAASRHYRGGSGSLGNVGVWACPGCGVKNTTPFEQGCPSCGAGKPGEVKTPQPQAKPAAPKSRFSPPRPEAPASSVAPSAPSISTSSGASQRGVPESGVVRVVRLIEYLIAPDKLQDGELTLRRSLVGTTLFQWGQITGTIVDELSARQEEILKLAKLQPGVWLGGPGEPPDHLRKYFHPLAEAENEMALTRPPAPKPAPQAAPPPPAAPPAPPAEEVLPDVGIAVSAEIQALAQEFAATYGYRFCNTLSLALSSIAEELRGNMEPRKFLDPDECMAFAQALMNAIPNEWEGDPEPGEDQTDETAS